MANTSLRVRIVMGSLAGLFILTSSALTIAVIVSMVQDSKSKSSTSSTQPKETNMLQGKPMANFTPVAKIDQLQEIDLTPGSGAIVKPGDTVTVDYTGAVAASGIVFQSSKDSGQPISFPLSGVIAGWSQGIPGMKVGGTRRLLIPANLAYGANPPQGAGIPANADLVFDVTLHKIGK